MLKIMRSHTKFLVIDYPCDVESGLIVNWHSRIYAFENNVAQKKVSKDEMYYFAVWNSK